MSNTQHIDLGIYDIFYSYHKEARKLCVDNMCMQAVDHFLLSDRKTPLTLFSTSFVNDLNAYGLERID